MGFLDCLEHRVTIDMAAHLSYEFTAVEVNVALHGMHPTKAPGPQGMVPIFF